MWVVLIVAGVVIIVWVWYSTKPTPSVSPPPPPPPAGDPVIIENEINSLMSDFEDGMQDLRDYGQTNGPDCARVTGEANRLKALLDTYKGNPNMSQSTYDTLKSNFQTAERFLDSWCTDYELY